MLSVILFTVGVTFIVTACIVYAFPKAFNLVSWEDYRKQQRLEWHADDRATRYEAKLFDSEQLTAQLLAIAANAHANNRLLRLETVALRNQLNTARAALRELACLGNGERPGNSLGNEIALRALNSCGKT